MKTFLTIVTIWMVTVSFAEELPMKKPLPIGHRGLMRDVPENTLSGFGACIDLGIGFELDVQRTKDGHLIVLHDDSVDRTTNGKGKVKELNLEEIKNLDAGNKFDSIFSGQTIPTLEEVFALLQSRKAKSLWIAMDVKIDDPTLEKDLVQLAKKYHVLDQLIFIGRTIEDPKLRKNLLEEDKNTQVSVLAQTSKDLQKAIEAKDAQWVYARFVPNHLEVDQIRKSGKKLFLSGTPVNNHEPENWNKAWEIGADVLLTDFPLECRRVWREKK